MALVPCASNLGRQCRRATAEHATRIATGLEGDMEVVRGQDPDPPAGREMGAGEGRRRCRRYGSTARAGGETDKAEYDSAPR
jgi:hypothetical protein